MNGPILTPIDPPTTPSATPRHTRKPSPGLAARLKALGFGSEKRQASSPSPHRDLQIGRIPEDQIRHLDHLHQSATSQSIEIQRRGRAWSGASGRLTPQITGGSSFTNSPAGRLTPQFTGGSFAGGEYRLDSGRRSTISTTVSEDAAVMNKAMEEMDTNHKYRLPDHINSNGTKATPATKQAHIESAPPYDESQPPTPVSKDMPQTVESYFNPNAEAPSSNWKSEDSPEEDQSFFNPLGLQRPGSIYTLSRVSFANQLAQLTSLSLPDADSLESHIAGIPTAPVANTQLISIANTVRAWISRASDLLAGLDADDDVEWAAAGGREGLDEVDSAVSRFEKLINVYVGSIDQLQKRSDVADVSKSKMTTLLSQTETILSEWGQIRKKLRGVKEQVELAMEWEDIWNVVLGDIGNEMGALNRLVFEIEEKRHKTIIIESSGGIDPAELDTIAEEFPNTSNIIPNPTNRFLPTGFPMSPNSPDMPPSMEEDDSSLMALSARLQPLHASLTFVPIRLSTYVPRAQKLFPTACEELETRRKDLENDWLRLKADADALQQELGEDKWIQVFRNANRSAERMLQAIERAIMKIKTSYEAGQYLVNPSAMAKKVDAYMKKKMHYGSAIEKVLQVIGNGLKDRLTVNGEISRMHQDTQARWDALREKLYDTDKIVEELQSDDDYAQLRDSMSTMVSVDTFSLNNSSSSSPASSVIESIPRPKGNGRRKSSSNLPKAGGITRRSASASNGGATPASQKKNPTSRLSTRGNIPSPSYATPSRQSSQTPLNRLPRPSLNASPDPSKPRWNASVKTEDLPPVRSHSSLAFTTPTPRSGVPSFRSSRSVSHIPGALSLSSPKESKIPLRSPLAREASSSPMPRRSNTPSRSRKISMSDSTSTLRQVSFSGIKSTPGPYSQQVLGQNRPRLSHKPSLSALNSSFSASTPPSSFRSTSKRASLLPSIERETQSGTSPSTSSPIGPPALERRAASSMASVRRTSMLPMARGRSQVMNGGSGGGGRADSPLVAPVSRMRRESSLISNGSGTGSAGSGDKPKWRGV